MAAGHNRIKVCYRFGGEGLLSSPEHEAVAVGADIHRNRVAIVHVAGQQHLGQLVADGLLHQSPQRARPVDRVESALR
jgi:hypothetical protein